jgi:hypothetical protein
MKMILLHLISKDSLRYKLHYPTTWEICKKSKAAPAIHSW